MNRRYRLVFNHVLGLFQVAAETTRLRGKAGGGGDAINAETAAPAPRLRALAAAVALGLGAFATPALAADIINTTPVAGATGGTGGNGGYSSGGSSGTGTAPSGAYANAGGAGGYPGDGQDGAGAAGSGGGAGIGGNPGWGGTGGNLATQGYGGGGGGGGGPGGSGGGGGGGVGMTLATGDTLDNSSVISGGDGGHAGLAFAAAGRGGGGGGGAGIFAAADVDIINSGTIQGGTGGNSMYGGGGGTAVILTGGSTLINSGTIYGGLSRITSTQDTAIELGGGGNTLELRAGSVILGTVISHGGDTFALGGTGVNSTFSVSQIGASAQYRGFDDFVKTGTGGWTLANTTTELTQWTIEQGTLSIANDGALGDVSGALTLAGGTLRTSAGINSARDIDITGNGTIDNNGAYNTFAGVISGGQLVLTGGGTTTLTGSNTHTGGTTVVNGRVSIASDHNLGASQGSLALDGGTLQTTAGLTLNRVIYVGFTANPSSSGGTSVIDNNGFDIQLDGNLTGNGNLFFTGTGNTLLRAVNDYTGHAVIGSGTLILDSYAALPGSLEVMDGATFSAGTAVLGSLDNGGTTIIPSAHTLTVTDDFTTSGTFQVNASDMGNYGQIDVGGTATLGGILAVNANPTGTFDIGGSLADIIRADSIVGTFASTRDNSTLFDFTPVYTSTTVSLDIVAAGSGNNGGGNNGGGDNGGGDNGGNNGGGDNGGNNGGGDNGGGDNGGLSLVEAIVASHGNSPAFGAAHALGQTFANDPTGALSARFMPFSTEQQVNDAVSQSLPLLTGNSTLAMQNTLSDINGIIQGRLEGQRGLSSGDAFANSQVWVKAFGSRADQNHNGAEAGFEADTYGVSLGVDGEITKGHRIGLAFAAAKADIDSDSHIAPQSAEVDIYQLVGYGSYALSANGELNYQLGFGQNQTDGKRVLPSFGLVAKADYDSTTTYAGIGYSHTLQLSEQTKLIPSVRIDYSKIEDESYRETGADVLNLHVSGNTSEALVIGADGKLEHRLNDKATLQFNVGFGYDLVADRDALTAVYAGAPAASFVTYGQDVDPWIANGGIGFAYQATDALEITARYDAQKRSRFDNQTASLKALWKF